MGGGIAAWKTKSEEDALKAVASDNLAEKSQEYLIPMSKNWNKLKIKWHEEQKQAAALREDRDTWKIIKI